MTKKELLLKTRAELVDLGVLEEIKINPKWNKGKMITALLAGDEDVDDESRQSLKEGEDKTGLTREDELEQMLKEAQQENRILSLEKKVHDSAQGERVIRDFGEIRESTRVKLGEEMIEFTPQIDPTSKKKRPYNILVQINGVGFGTNKGEKFLVPKRLATEVYRLISEGLSPGAVTIPNPNLD